MKSRILIADDDASIRELVAALLVSEDYEVSFAADGAEAIERARLEQPDVVILDVTMPGTDGLEACRTLKGEVETAGIAVLMLTARTDFADRVAGEDAKADAYLTKPFSPFTLTRMVEHLVEVRAAKRDA